MADFRKWFYALAVVTLLAGLTAPVYAQSQPFICQANAGVPPIVRAEGYADLVGDFILACQGGTPTPAGQSVPQVNVTVLLSTNITSRLLAGNLFNEALLIVDEPNSAANPARPLLNCGDFGAPDTSISGLGVCGIISTGDPTETYDGSPNGWWTTDDGGAQTFCDGTDPDGEGPLVQRPAANTFGCGRPNVFQGRTGVAQNPGQSNSVVFLGVPLDPPGTATTRTLRITNIRADAEFTGVSSTFTTSQIQMNVSINGNTSLAINNPQQIVAYVQRGLQTLDIKPKFDFVQCLNAVLPDLEVLTNGSALFSIDQGARTLPFADPRLMSVRFTEGFASSWKVKGFEHVLVNGTFNGVYYDWNGGTAYPAVGVRQNVPGALYNTESGFTSHPTAQASPAPNPPNGIGTVPVSGEGVLRHRLTGAPGGGTGIESAGIATQGTRLALTFQNIPAGTVVAVPSVVLITRTGTNVITGVAVRTATTSNGAGAYTRVSNGSIYTWTGLGSDQLAVYEVLFADPFSLEDLTVPIGVQFASDLAQNLPDPTVTAQVAGGFAPFYDPAPAPRSPSATLPVPRFIPGSAPEDLFRINKCACNLLFPFVTNADAGTAAFDTGIALANTSLDPGSAFGFIARAQEGTVQFWYYNTAAPTAAPPPQCTNVASPGTCPGTTVVPAGGVLTYVLSQGSAEWGLDNRGAGFTGYMIAQAQFQYCHAFAFISRQGAGPADPGLSVGYLALVLDQGSDLPRTSQFQNDALDQ